MILSHFHLRLKDNDVNDLHIGLLAKDLKPIYLGLHVNYVNDFHLGLPVNDLPPWIA
jgi:hypothetical protein